MNFKFNKLHHSWSATELTSSGADSEGVGDGQGAMPPPNCWTIMLHNLFKVVGKCIGLMKVWGLRELLKRFTKVGEDLFFGHLPSH